MVRNRPTCPKTRETPTDPLVVCGFTTADRDDTPRPDESNTPRERRSPIRQLENGRRVGQSVGDSVIGRLVWDSEGDDTAATLGLPKGEFASEPREPPIHQPQSDPTTVSELTLLAVD